MLFFEKAVPYLRHSLSQFALSTEYLSWFGFYITKQNKFIFEFAMIICGFMVYIFNRNKLSPNLVNVFDFATCYMVISLMPLHQSGPSSLGYRLLLISPLFAIPFVIIMTYRLISNIAVLTCCITLILTGAIFIFSCNLTAIRYSHFPAWSTLAQNMQAVKNKIGKNDIIITHHGLKFYITYTIDRRTTEYIPTAECQKIYRIAYIPLGRPGGADRLLLEKKLLMPIGADYGLFEEKDWQKLVKNINLKPHWKNPHQPKPDFLY